MAMRAAGTFTGPSSEAAHLIKQKDWTQDKKQAPVMLALMLKSKAKNMTRVSVKLSVDNNERKNVNFPITELKENIFASDNKQAYFFLKIDPSKEDWGDIRLEVSAKPGKTSKISTSGSYGGGYSGNTSSYAGGGVSWGIGDDGWGANTMYEGGQYYGGGTSVGTSVGVGTSTSYKPIGVVSGDAKVMCVNC